ncbi:MAG: exodeoxyribonuclease VII small subunit, partial [Solirubrobacterales bacterium]
SDREGIVSQELSDREGIVSEELSYEMGVARVEEIVRRLDAGEASLGETLQLVKEGKELIEHCARELEAVGNALEELRLEDLVARLEGEGAQGAGGAETGGSR